MIKAQLFNQRAKMFGPGCAELGLVNDLMDDIKGILPFDIPIFG